MVVNFRAHEIGRDTHKLVWTPTLIIIKINLNVFLYVPGRKMNIIETKSYCKMNINGLNNGFLA